MLRYYITDRRASQDILASISRAVQSGVDLIQIREKDLPARELLQLTQQAVLRAAGSSTKILVSERLDIAIAAGAHGIHLPSRSILPSEYRRIAPPGFLIGVSCHSETELAETAGADFAVYGPVFETPGKGVPAGLGGLRRAARSSPVPLLALGGITEENAAACIEAGAAGVAAIRMFQDPDLR